MYFDDSTWTTLHIATNATTAEVISLIKRKRGISNSIKLSSDSSNKETSDSLVDHVLYISDREGES